MSDLEDTGDTDTPPSTIQRHSAHLGVNTHCAMNTGFIHRLLLESLFARSPAHGVGPLFLLCCLLQSATFCSPQPNLPFASGNAYLSPLHIASQTGSVLLDPLLTKGGGTHDVEMFYDDKFYHCSKSPQAKSELHRIVSTIYRLEPFYPYKNNCSEPFHPLYLMRYPGRTSKSLIGQTNVYNVLYNETTDVVLYKNNIVAIPSNFFCTLRNVINVEIGGSAVVSSENFGFSRQCVSNDCCLTLRKLRVTNNGLKTLVAGSFCGFPNLEELDVSKNSLDSVDDDAFVKLDRLLKLSLSENQLKSLPQGVFQPLKGLIVLDLSSNHFNDSIFGRLGMLSALKVLWLSSNYITAIQSNRISGFDALAELYLNNNHIVSLENPFGKLPNLALLALNVNLISHIASTTFVPLVNLTVLNLAHNEMYQLSGAHFNANEKLEQLDITGNKFWSVPDFTSVKSLKKLVLSDNKMTTITPEDGKVICNMHGLEELHMEVNLIANISEGALDCNLTLMVLNLNTNNIRSIRGAFANVKIEQLQIARNVIEELWLDDIAQNIIEVDLSSNRIALLNSPFKQSLRNMTLARLKLDENRIADLSSVHLPPSLQYLSLDNNKLEAVDLGNFEVTSNSTYFQLENLKLLSLGSNHIRSVCPLIFYLIASETYPDLELKENPLKCSCEIDFLLNYEKEIRPGQSMTNLPVNGTCPSWQQRSVNEILSTGILRDRFSCKAEHSQLFCQCNLNSFYSSICRFPCPKRCLCFLSSNYKFQFVNCTGAALDNLPVLQSKLPIELHFANNSLKSIDETILRTYSKAVALHFNDNQINRIERGAFKGVPHLKVLNLEANLLKNLPDGAFDNLLELTELYLAHNRLLYLTTRVFRPLSAIRVIQLHDNNLRNFSIWNISVSSTLSGLSLRDNPWSCDCHYIEQFRSWLQNYSNIVEDVSKLFCTVDNGTVQNSPLISFNSSQCYVLKDEILITNVALWTSVLASVSFVAMLCVMVFIYRREMQIIIYSNYGVRLFYKNMEELDANKLYDAFVAHSALDEEFLVMELVPHLEQIEQPYCLCIHQRDFLVGAVISESILEAVEKSRRTIVLLSENFVRSEWCRFEFKSAHLKTLTDRCNRLIVIVLGQLPTDLDPEMKLYLKTNTYLEWGDRLFWEKLYFALPDRRSSK